MIFVESIKKTPIEEQKIEIVERKGIGHPDSIADGIAESISRALCKEYIKRYGVILHHNTDQVEVVGGRAKVYFGGGEVINPIYILLSGRATTFVGDEIIPVGKIAIKAAKEYLKVIRNLDVESDVIIDSRIGQGSSDLVDVFKRKKDIPLANDTSFGVGYAPLSETEKLVLETEKLLNSDKFKKKYRETGEDIKVMAVREENKINLTVACAMISRYIPDIDHYISVKEDIMDEIKDLICRITEKEVNLSMNTADDYERKVVYITVTGTSAEMGDDGSVGRGNRVNGLITPNRQMSLEAAAGKNPVSHIGKLYNTLAFRIANKIAEIDDVREVYVKMLSQIGKPINKPKVVSIQLITDKLTRNIEEECKAIVEEHLENIKKLTEEFVEGKISVF